MENSLNFGWYEIMDRIAMIQNQLHDNINEHQVADVGVQLLVDEAQGVLSALYNYAGKKFDESLESICD